MTLRIGDLGGQAILAAGPPSSSTLGSGTFRVGQAYKDTTAKVWYLCSTAGDKSSSVWDAIGPGTMTLKTGSGGGNYTGTNTTYADLDATNLAYTVTIPTGWKMKIDCAMSGNSTGNNGSVALTDGVTLLAELWDGLGSTNNGVSLTYEFTGDGASHTFKLRVLTQSGTWTIPNGSATNTPMMSFLLMPSN